MPGMTKTRTEKEDYLSLTGNLRVLEKRILSDDGLNKLVAAGGFDEVIKSLSQHCEYDFASGKPEDYERVLDAARKNLYRTYYQKCGEPFVMDIAVAKYDYHNIKVAIKAYFLHKDFSQLYIDASLIEPADIAAAVARAYEGVDDMSDSVVPVHLIEAVKAGVSAFDGGRNPQGMDIELDKHCLAHMLERCNELKNDFVTNYVRKAIDFYNVKTLLRIRHTGGDEELLKRSLADGGFVAVSLLEDCAGNNVIDVMAKSGAYDKFFVEAAKRAIEDYARSGNYGELERFFDNELLNHVKRSKMIAYGAEVLFSYIISKENELRQIRILLSCKQNGISDQVIMERLRENYA